MAAAIKQRITLVSASPAQELWRVAESGDVAELARVLSVDGVGVNERNPHGMTALMRAAYHGHGQMVSALLDHGADPNLTRNDKFTALALAAFFGHTETVRILLEHGARREVLTRCGASAYMWATARTFDEAARCLEAPGPATPLPLPIRTHATPLRPPIRTHETPLVVKALKDPPEIWDLVQEVRPSFNARGAFMARVRSMNSHVGIAVLAVLVLMVAGGVGVLYHRGSEMRPNSPVSPAEAPPIIENLQVTAPPEIPKTEEPVLEPEPEVVQSNHPLNVSRPNRSRSSAGRRDAIEVVESREASSVAALPVAASPKFAEPAEKPAVKKTAGVLSPKLIAPAKEATPKAKVIQWP